MERAAWMVVHALTRLYEGRGELCPRDYEGQRAIIRRSLHDLNEACAFDQVDPRAFDTLERLLDQIDRPSPPHSERHPTSWRVYHMLAEARAILSRDPARARALEQSARAESEALSHPERSWFAPRLDALAFACDVP